MERLWESHHSAGSESGRIAVFTARETAWAQSKGGIWGCARVLSLATSHIRSAASHSITGSPQPHEPDYRTPFPRITSTLKCGTANGQSLKQPPGNPPAWAFGPVWTILYGMMGYASHLVVEVADKNLNPTTSKTAVTALGMYYAQLALNFAWMPLFFTGESKSGRGILGWWEGVGGEVTRWRGVGAESEGRGWERGQMDGRGGCGVVWEEGRERARRMRDVCEIGETSGEEDRGCMWEDENGREDD